MNRMNKARLGIASAVLSGVMATGVASSATASATSISRAPVHLQTVSLSAAAPSSLALAPAAPSAVTPSLLLGPASEQGGIWPFIKAVVSFLGKSVSWLKSIVQAGYNAFLTHVWNKIPGWIKTIAGWGWTAWEVFNEVKDYLF